MNKSVGDEQNIEHNRKEKRIAGKKIERKKQNRLILNISLSL